MLGFITRVVLANMVWWPTFVSYILYDASPILYAQLVDRLVTDAVPEKSIDPVRFSCDEDVQTTYV